MLIRIVVALIVAFVYINGRVYDGDDGLIFESTRRAIKIRGSINFYVLKRKIHDKLKLCSN